MKKVIVYFFTCCFLTVNISQAQETNIVNNTDSTGLPGDNFNLQGALSLFKQSSTLEDFEKQLNSEDNYVNNLDMNSDGKTDYVFVSDNSEGNSHAIVLQVAVNETENQDIAVIEIEKNGEETADLQIIGDEDIYGEKKIIEPADDKEIIYKKGPSAPSFGFVIVNVWFWPCVKFIYAPGYVVWKSPWHWHHYPPYWKPWNPHPWYWHYEHCKPYYVHFRTAPKHRVVIAHQVYLPHRKTSVIVTNRNKPVINQYRKTHSIPAVKQPRVTKYKSNNVRNQKATYAPRNNGNNKGGKGGNKNSGGGHRK